jgi:hypothetical protein
MSKFRIRHPCVAICREVGRGLMVREIWPYQSYETPEGVYGNVCGPLDCKVESELPSCKRWLPDPMAKRRQPMCDGRSLSRCRGFRWLPCSSPDNLKQHPQVPHPAAAERERVEGQKEAREIIREAGDQPNGTPSRPSTNHRRGVSWTPAAANSSQHRYPSSLVSGSSSAWHTQDHPGLLCLLPGVLRGRTVGSTLGLEEVPASVKPALANN